MAARLPSRSSAGAGLEVAPLFGSLIGTTQASDFSSVSRSGVWPLAFPDPPTANCSVGSNEISQFLFKELLRMLRVFDRVEFAEGSHSALVDVAFRFA